MRTTRTTHDAHDARRIEVLWRVSVTELSLGSRQIKEMGGRCCATLQAGELESGLENSATRVCQVLSGVLHADTRHSDASLRVRVDTRVTPAHCEACREGLTIDDLELISMVRPTDY